MNQKTLVQRTTERGRPTWGFCRVQVQTVCRLWCAYQSNQLQRRDVQVWFACHELQMRRCRMKPGRQPTFSKQELEPLTDLGATDIRASIRRLEARGFLSWSDHALDLKSRSDESVAGLTAMLAQVTNHRRTLPIPRHTVLLLARTRRPVLLASLLGHLFRGMYYRSRECLSWGTCKSSWIAETFGVDVRNVKTARGELQRIGWLRPMPSHHWHRQRYGGSFVLPLDWTAKPITPRRERIPPPRRHAAAAESPPPESDKNLPSGIKNQNRQKQTGFEYEKTERPEEPKLQHVLRVDLHEPHRTAKLFHQAVNAGFIQDSVASRLQFFAAAKRAGRLASNPGGFFLTVVKKQLWRNITIRDEDQGRAALAATGEFAHGNVPIPFGSRQTIPPRRPHKVRPRVESAATIRELIGRSLASVPDTYFPLPPRSGELFASGAKRGQGGTVGEEAPCTRGVAP